MKVANRIPIRARFIDPDTKNVVTASANTNNTTETKLKQAVLRQAQRVVTDHTSTESVTKLIRNHLQSNHAVLANSTHLYLLTEGGLYTKVKMRELAMSIRESIQKQKSQRLQDLQEKLNNLFKVRSNDLNHGVQESVELYTQSAIERAELQSIAKAKTIRIFIDVAKEFTNRDFKLNQDNDVFAANNKLYRVRERGDVTSIADVEEQVIYHQLQNYQLNIDVPPTSPGGANPPRDLQRLIGTKLLCDRHPRELIVHIRSNDRSTTFYHLLSSMASTYSTSVTDQPPKERELKGKRLLFINNSTMLKPTGEAVIRFNSNVLIVVFSAEPGIIIAPKEYLLYESDPPQNIVTPQDLFEWLRVGATPNIDPELPKDIVTPEEAIEKAALELVTKYVESKGWQPKGDEQQRLKLPLTAMQNELVVFADSIGYRPLPPNQRTLANALNQLGFTVMCPNNKFFLHAYSPTPSETDQIVVVDG